MIIPLRSQEHHVILASLKEVTETFWEVVIPDCLSRYRKFNRRVLWDLANKVPVRKDLNLPVRSKELPLSFLGVNMSCAVSYVCVSKRLLKLI